MKVTVVNMDAIDVGMILMVHDIMVATLMAANLNQNPTLGSVRVTVRHSLKCLIQFNL